MKSTSRRSLLRSAAAVGWVVATGRSGAAAPATVAAASDLKFAIEEIAATFERGSGDALRLIFGSSGHFAAQLQQGAPFDLFMSADESYVFRLADAGLTVDRGRLYARGRIGVMVNAASPLAADGSLADLRAAIADGRLRKFAIANPAHAPYGRRAEEALRHAGLWEAIQPHLVFGENISQAAQFATSGAAQGGIVAQSLALAPTLSGQVRFGLIAESWHQPLLQRMVLMRGAAPAARAFFDHLTTPAAQAVMARYGFAVPRD